MQIGSLDPLLRISLVIGRASRRTRPRLQTDGRNLSARSSFCPRLPVLETGFPLRYH